jgi:hypothetical protein
MITIEPPLAAPAVKRGKPTVRTSKKALKAVMEDDDIENMETAIDAMEREEPQIERPTLVNKKSWMVSTCYAQMNII